LRIISAGSYYGDWVYFLGYRILRGKHLPPPTTKTPVPLQNLVGVAMRDKCVLHSPMFALLIRILLALRSTFEARASREAEILVLRQQLLVLSRKTRKRVRLRSIDRLILVWLYRLFRSMLDAIVIVKPETVIRWHGRGFRAYWRGKSWRREGRPRIGREIRELIRRMSRENPLWGASRIHGELLMLGIDVSESTVGRYMIRAGRPRSQGILRLGNSR
jgi:hypothetical protein